MNSENRETTADGKRVPTTTPSGVRREKIDRLLVDLGDKFPKRYCFFYVLLCAALPVFTLWALPVIFFGVTIVAARYARHYFDRETLIAGELFPREYAAYASEAATRFEKYFRVPFVIGLSIFFGESGAPAAVLRESVARIANVTLGDGIIFYGSLLPWLLMTSVWMYWLFCLPAFRLSLFAGFLFGRNGRPITGLLKALGVFSSVFFGAMVPGIGVAALAMTLDESGLAPSGVTTLLMPLALLVGLFGIPLLVMFKAAQVLKNVFTDRLMTEIKWSVYERA